MDTYLQFVGMGGAPLVREMVKATGSQNGLVNVLLSVVYGVLLNIALAVILGNDLRIGLALGILTAFLSNLYHDVKTAE